MIEIIHRIKEAYNLKTDAEVAKFLEIKPSTLSMQKNRGRLNLKRILEKCSDLNRNWLLDGEGPKKKPNRATYIPVYSSLNIANTGELNLKNSAKIGNIFVDISNNISKIPSLDHMIGYVISGNGMPSNLRSDDIAIIDLERTTPKDETVFLFLVDHSIFCRRVKKNSGDYYMVTADNAEKDSIHISEDPNNYEIIGEMIWIMRGM